jgi:integrase/recombinase XerD
MNNAELIARFFAYMRAERGASENTVSEYQRDIHKFAEWLGGELRAATRNSFQMYMSFLIAGGKSGSTARRRLCCFRTFYQFLTDEGEIAIDPTLNLPDLGHGKSSPSQSLRPISKRWLLRSGHRRSKSAIKLCCLPSSARV